MSRKRWEEIQAIFDRLWTRIHPPRSISVSGLRMGNDRIATLNRAYNDQSARQFDGVRG